MAIDLGNDPGGTPPTAGEKLQIRSAIGVGTTDAPTFLAQTLTGTLTASESGVSKNPAVAFPVSGSYAVGIWSPASYTIQFAMAPSGSLTNTTAYTGLQYEMTAGTLSWGGTSQDIKLARDAAGILAQRNGVNAQAFRVYNTFPGTGNNEYAEIAWSANYMYVRPAAAGSGVVRGSVFGVAGSDTFIDGSSTTFRGPGNTQRWTINLSGHFLAATDNTYDIGASGANRPRTIYAGSGINAGTGSTSVFQFANAVAVNLTGGSYGGASQLALFAPSDGVLRITNGATSDFGRLQLGGTTSAFPAIKRNGTGIDIVLADNSALAPITAAIISVGSAIVTSAVGIGSAQIRAVSNNKLRFINNTLDNFTAIEIGEADMGVMRGAGTPEGAVTAKVGSIFLRTDGTSGSSFYVKESGSGNTGWVGK